MNEEGTDRKTKTKNFFPFFLFWGKETGAKKEIKHVPYVVRIHEGAKRRKGKAPRRGAIKIPKKLGGEKKRMKTKELFGIEIPAILIAFALLSAIMVMPALANGVHDNGMIRVENTATGDGTVTVKGTAENGKTVFEVKVAIGKNDSEKEAAEKIRDALNQNSTFNANYNAKHFYNKTEKKTLCNNKKETYLQSVV